MDIQEIVSGIASSDALKGLAEKIGLSPDQAQGALQGVIEHVTAENPLEGMVEGVASKVGVPPEQVQQLLPHVLGLLQGHADNASEGVQGMLGGLLGSMQNSPLAGLLGHGEGQGEGASALEGLVGNLLGGHDKA
jgi:hypothetical protein